MRLRLFRMLMLGIVVGSLGVWVATADTGVAIASVDKAGWWTQRPGALPVGEGKIEVANSVRGEESVAALRVLIRGEVTNATLVLDEATAPLNPLAPGALRICTTNDPWLLADGGAWDARPGESCDSAIKMTRSVEGDAGKWTANITGLLQGAFSEISLMIVPSDEATGLLDSTWFMTVTPHITADGTPDAAPTTTIATSSPPVVGNTPTAPRVTSSGPTATPTPSTEAAAPAAPVEPRRFEVASSNTPKKPWGKLIFPLLPLSALLALGYTYAKNYVENRAAIA